MGIIVLQVVLFALDVIQWIVVVWAVLSWIIYFASRSSFRWRYRSAYITLNKLNDILTRVTRPLLRPFRRMLSKSSNMGGIDWSPLLLLLTIYCLRILAVYIYTSLMIH